MQGAMVGPAQRHRILIADAPAESARLGEPQMMGVRRPSAADQAWLGRHEPEVRTIAVAALFAQCEGTFVDVPCYSIVDPGRGAELRRQASDLGGQTVEGTGKAAGNGHDAKRRNGNGADRSLGTFATSRKPWSPPKQALEPVKSAVLRDRLLAEVSAVASQEEATAWAQKAMAAKNTLATEDSRVVEAAFAARLELTDQDDSHSAPHVDEAHGAASNGRRGGGTTVARRPANLPRQCPPR
jgi:hypothetical protein